MFEVADACGSAGAFTRLSEGGQQHTCKNGDDRDHDKQFNKGEFASDNIDYRKQKNNGKFREVKKFKETYFELKNVDSLISLNSLNSQQFNNINLNPKEKKV